MLAREHSEVVGWEKEATLETIIGNDKRQMNVAMLKTAGQAQAAVLDKMYFYTWMPDLILTQKCREQMLYDHRRCPDTQDSSVPAFERPRSRAQHVSFHQ